MKMLATKAIKASVAKIPQLMFAPAFPLNVSVKMIIPRPSEKPTKFEIVCITPMTVG